MKIHITIISVLLISINQDVSSQSLNILKNITIGELINIEKRTIRELSNNIDAFSKINVKQFSFYDFSYSMESHKDTNIFYRLFLDGDTIKRILYFDKKHSATKPIYGTDICYTNQYKIFFIHNDYYASDWEKNNYVGFIISDNKENIHLFFGYAHEFGNLDDAEDIDRIFLLDSNLLTKKQLLFKKGILRYITEPIRENHEYKYEKSYKSNKYIELTEKTKLSNILKLLETKFDTLNYKILYINGLGMSSKKPFRREVYPLWSASNILYYPCMVLYKDEKENKVYYRQKYGENNIYERVIDNQIRGELECFDWLY